MSEIARTCRWYGSGTLSVANRSGRSEHRLDDAGRFVAVRSRTEIGVFAADLVLV